ncbi:hypothetical protein A5748_25305 [Nocardia sp. 852002-51244_SCH5132740]|nr:hypothetical protein A5748_25305 [Nocardia sp. 852002-51244_SCH5132740]
MAHLFDIAKAAPKKPPSPAQIAAAANAVRAHQAYAAERHGIALDDLTRTDDPGPGWNTTPETTTQEENTMSTTDDLGELLDQAQQLQADLARDDLEFEVGEMFDHVYNLESLMRRAQQAGTDERAAANAARARKLFEEFLLGKDRGELEQIEHWQHYYDDIEGARADAIHQQRIDDFFDFDDRDDDTDTETEEDNTVPKTAQPQLGVATGHGQRMAHLLAVAGVNRARWDRQLRESRTRGPRFEEEAAVTAEFEAETVADRAAAENRLESTNPWQNPWRLTQSLADALTWQGESDIAAERATEIVRGYAEQWGVVIDADAMQVSIDPRFDPIPRQTRDEASALFARESAAVDFVTALPIPDSVKGAVSQAVLNWRGEDIEDPAAHITSAQARRDKLAADLDAAGVTGITRARVDFVVDYLRGDTSGVDLVQSPVYIDRGEAMRGKVTDLLEMLNDGTIQPQRMTREISVMTTADQKTVRDAWIAYKKGQRGDLDVWPGYLDRQALTDDIKAMVRNRDDLTQASDYIVDTDISRQSPEMIGVNDDIEAQIQGLAYAGDQLLAQIQEGKGLAPIERAQIAAIVEDVDTGRVRSLDDLPELLLVDEDSKRALDSERIGATAEQLVAAMKSQATDLIRNAGVDIDNRIKSRDIGLPLSQLTDSVRSVAAGAVINGVDHERRAYARHRDTFGRALAAAGVDDQSRGKIRAAIDAGAREAGHLGQAAAEREQQWDTKFERIVMMRDDAARTAASSPSRACTARPDKTAAQSRSASAAPAGVGGRRNLRQAGAER